MIHDRKLFRCGILLTVKYHVRTLYVQQDNAIVQYEKKYGIELVGKLQQVHKFHYFSVRVQYVFMFANLFEAIRSIQVCASIQMSCR